MNSNFIVQFPVKKNTFINSEHSSLSFLHIYVCEYMVSNMPSLSGGFRA